jgi:hypothetical protein
MNRQELEKAKKDGTVLALRRQRFSTGRKEITVTAPAVPVKVTAVHARMHGTGSGRLGKGSTGCEVVLVREGVESIVAPVEDRDLPIGFDHVIDDIPRRVDSHYDRDTRETTHTPTEEPMTFAAIDFLMPWERYAPHRNRWLERKREKANARTNVLAEEGRLFGIAERAFGHIPVAIHKGVRTEWVERDGRRQIDRITTFEIDLADAEKVAAWMEQEILAGDPS